MALAMEEDEDDRFAMDCMFEDNVPKASLDEWEMEKILTVGRCFDSHHERRNYPNDRLSVMENNDLEQMNHNNDLER